MKLTNSKIIIIIFLLLIKNSKKYIVKYTDGGLGCVGTVVELGEPGSKRTPDNTVVVCWDSGSRSNYRTGYQGQYDLIMVDNAQCGTKTVTHYLFCVIMISIIEFWVY